MPKSATVLDARVCTACRRATGRLRGAAAAAGAASVWPARAVRKAGARLALAGRAAAQRVVGGLSSACGLTAQRACCGAAAVRSRNGAAARMPATLIVSCKQYHGQRPLCGAGVTRSSAARRAPSPAAARAAGATRGERGACVLSGTCRGRPAVAATHPRSRS